ncbi:MAG: T9SS type A sorting domain-containing protein [Flavisolibacter sp.]
MRQYSVILFLIIQTTLAKSQTQISGIINNYYRVVKIVPEKSCILVDNPAGLSYNDRIMIVQMKGITVNSTNSSAFGSATNMNNAGKYEIGTVCWIKMDSVFLYQTLLQSYTVSDKVQLVRIPQYESAIVTDSLKAAPWDSTSGKGGVLAFTVYDNLILSGPVSAIGAGYKGGLYATSNTTCSNLTAPAGFFYNATSLTPQSGAWKGESAADLAISFSGGRGAIANGGGGGNNHNNGGGGGSNIGAGGIGGGNSSASGCSVANPGIGGYALSTNNGQRIFMGGGGGAGHANSGLPSSGGGRGGGIIFIQANTIYTNGYKILANGVKGGNTTGDGASGGGGGGTIIFDVNNFVGGINAEAAGAIGGTESDDNTSQKCYGEGGGGGGGIVYLKSSLPAGTINVNGGPKGVKQFYLNCAPLVAAAAGSPGIVVPDYTYMQSSTISSYCEVVLPVQLTSFTVNENNGDAELDWEIENVSELNSFTVQRRKDGSGWENINIIPASGMQKKFSSTDNKLLPGSYQYRLMVEESNGHSAYSMIRGLRIRNLNSRLIIFPNPASTSVNLVYPFRENQLVHIYDVLGKLVLTKKITASGNLYNIDVSSLRNGIYQVSVEGKVARMIVE